MEEPEPPLLVVLVLDSGLGFPSSPGPFQVDCQHSCATIFTPQVKARLEDAWLESALLPSSTKPHFGTELAWEVGAGPLRELRRRRATVRVEVWQEQRVIGHQLLDVRTAVTVTSAHLANTSWHKLKGCSLPELRLGMGLVTLQSGEEELESGEETPVPVLVEGEGKGHFELGPRELATGRFSLSVCVQSGEWLAALVPPSTSLPPGHGFYFHYSLLGVDISTEPFPDLGKPAFLPERATAQLLTSGPVLAAFLASSTLSLHLCHGGTVLASSSLPLSSLLPLSAEGETTHQASLALLPHLPQAGDHHQATLTLSVSLKQEQHQLETQSSRAPSFSERAPSPPTRLEREEQASRVSVPESHEEDLPSLLREPGLGDISQASECTAYQSPPPAKHPRLTPQSLFQTPEPRPPTSDPPGATTAYNLSLELRTISLISASTSLVLSYKYAALHPRAITTQPGFATTALQPTPVPRGFCQFSFAVHQDKMRDTFTRHQLKVLVKDEGGRVGAAVVELAKVLDQPLAKGRQTYGGTVDITSGQASVGKLSFEVKLGEAGAEGGDGGVRSSSGLVPNTGPVGEGSRREVAAAVEQVERWKAEQREQFTRSLVEAESRHLALLGEEWREREVAREGRGRELREGRPPEGDMEGKRD